jgi:hypothetical protein
MTSVCLSVDERRYVYFWCSRFDETTNRVRLVTRGYPRIRPDDHQSWIADRIHGTASFTTSGGIRAELHDLVQRTFAEKEVVRRIDSFWLTLGSCRHSSCRNAERFRALLTLSEGPAERCNIPESDCSSANCFARGRSDSQARTVSLQACSGFPAWRRPVAHLPSREFDRIDEAMCTMWRGARQSEGEEHLDDSTLCRSACRCVDKFAVTTIPGHRLVVPPRIRRLRLVTFRSDGAARSSALDSVRFAWHTTEVESLLDGHHLVAVLRRLLDGASSIRPDELRPSEMREGMNRSTQLVSRASRELPQLESFRDVTLVMERIKGDGASDIGEISRASHVVCQIKDCESIGVAEGNAKVVGPDGGTCIDEPVLAKPSTDSVSFPTVGSAHTAERASVAYEWRFRSGFGPRVRALGRDIEIWLLRTWHSRRDKAATRWPLEHSLGSGTADAVTSTVNRVLRPRSGPEVRRVESMLTRPRGDWHTSIDAFAGDCSGAFSSQRYVSATRELICDLLREAAGHVTHSFEAVTRANLSTAAPAHNATLFEMVVVHVLRQYRLGYEITDLGSLRGCLIKTTHTSTVHVNDRLDSSERAFVALHELAHLRLAHQPGSVWGLAPSCVSEEARTVFDEQEREANDFAEMWRRVFLRLVGHRYARCDKDSEPLSVQVSHGCQPGDRPSHNEVSVAHR